MDHENAIFNHHHHHCIIYEALIVSKLLKTNKKVQ